MTKLKGRGRLVPSRMTGIAYQVRYGIPVFGDPFQSAKPGRPMQWADCSVHCPNAGRLPDGAYFLYMASKGRVEGKERILFFDCRDALLWLNETPDALGSYWHFAQ